MQNYKDFISEILIDEKTLQNGSRNWETRSATIMPARIYCSRASCGRNRLHGGPDAAYYRPHALDCMALTSYGVGARASTGNIRMSLDLQTNIENKNVLLVEDIVDSGTPSSMCSKCSRHAAQKPESVRIAGQGRAP